MKRVVILVVAAAFFVGAGVAAARVTCTVDGIEGDKVTMTCDGADELKQGDSVTVKAKKKKAIEGC